MSLFSQSSQTRDLPMIEDKYYDNDLSLTTEREYNPLYSSEVDKEAVKRSKQEIFDIDDALKTQFLPYRLLLLLGVFLSILDSLLRIVNIFTISGLLFIFYRGFEVHTLMRAYEAQKKSAIKEQRAVVKLLKIIMIVSAIIWLYYIVYAISVALRESSRVLVPENSQFEEFEEQMDLDIIPPPENPETPKSENKLTNFFISNYKPTALLIIGFFGLVIPYYLYHKSKKIEALLERRSILNRDVRMPRLVTWDW